jgi:ABC-type cobalamin/Fe3+-siderophores transport system ATPase subunit
VEEWQTQCDDDGIAFQDKLYAVFPGFEPSLRDGKQGLHLLFLFDPGIGRERYLRLYDVLMGGASPYDGRTLRPSSKSAKDCFEEMRGFAVRERGPGSDEVEDWHYLILAPHIELDTGLLGAQKGEVLRLFKHDEIRGLELGDNKLPEDTIKGRTGWLPQGMKDHRQAFFHSSDAYSIEAIGERHVWLKLASPTIEALRQAFIASESRIRVGFELDESHTLCPLSKPPDVMASRRPWLRSVSVHGAASFFGAGSERAVVELSPDLTCIIGGSMTGKSTLLDGLRVHVNASLPENVELSGQVKARGKDRFGAGSAEVSMDCPGADFTKPLHEQWPAVFYTQNELQRLADQPDAVDEILTRLVPEETQGMQEREQKLVNMDAEAQRMAQDLAKLDEEEAEAQQALERAQRAKNELKAFSEAGVEQLNNISQQRQQWQKTLDDGEKVKNELYEGAEEAQSLALPDLSDELAYRLREQEMDPQAPERQWQNIQKQFEVLQRKLEAWSRETGKIVQVLEAYESELRTSVERALAEQGFDFSRIQEFQSLSEQAALLESCRDNLQNVQQKRQQVEDKFQRLLTERKDLVETQREAFDRVTARIATDFEGRIRVQRIDDGRSEPMENFILGLKQKGVTQWWNGLAKKSTPSPQVLVQALEDGRLDEWGMSSAVQESFRELMTPERRRKLRALRNPDHYILEHLVEGSEVSEYRRMDMLSGGRRVSVLLSLLLKTSDERPLIIDQPEDQLDNSFLFKDVLPALRTLKGERQIIVATHNANIVVNGDADQVIQLEASGYHGQVACSGAIEEPVVRDAIVQTVDGGHEAFRLRRLKYGF